jgi:hypothetical protein
MSEANRQTQSKDPVRADNSAGNERNFRIVIRFFDEYEAEQLPTSSREAEECESPAGKRRPNSS